MLRELHISGLGVIDDLDLELHPGLNVLTGETGAGKTMVTVGLALALGTRADSSLVRDGAKAARVQARFDATESAVEWSEDGEVLLARSVNADGQEQRPRRRTARDRLDARRARERIRRGARATPGAAFAVVDDPDGVPRSVRGRRRIWSPSRSIARRGIGGATPARRSRRSRRRSRERERELDLLAYQVNEIEAVDPSDGETERLDRRGGPSRARRTAARAVDGGGGDARGRRLAGRRGGVLGERARRGGPAGPAGRRTRRAVAEPGHRARRAGPRRPGLP